MFDYFISNLDHNIFILNIFVDHLLIIDKRRGGGVSMFINNRLNFQVRNDIINFNLKK